MRFYHRYSIGFPTSMIFDDVDIPERDILIINELLGIDSKSHLVDYNMFTFMIVTRYLELYSSLYSRNSNSISWSEYEEWYGDKIDKLLEDIKNGKHNPKEE